MLTTIIGLSSLVLAQSQDATSTSQELVVANLWDFVEKGGVMMIPIGICSFVAMAVFIERLVSLRRENVIPKAFLVGLKKILKKDPTNKTAAIKYCKKNKSPVANVFASGIKSLDVSIESMQQHIDDAGSREVVKLRRFVRVLSVIASVAPLLGLLGTIFGMIRAFQTVAVMGEALGKTELLAEGIYEAMITTAAGLCVAIPVLIAYHLISSKIDRLVADIDQMTVDFLEELADGGFGAVDKEPKVETAKSEEPVIDETSVKIAAT